jgi:hypothetical protein
LLSEIAWPKDYYKFHFFQNQVDIEEGSFWEAETKDESNSNPFLQIMRMRKPSSDHSVNNKSVVFWRREKHSITYFAVINRFIEVDMNQNLHLENITLPNLT